MDHRVVVVALLMALTLTVGPFVVIGKLRDGTMSRSEALWIVSGVVAIDVGAIFIRQGGKLLLAIGAYVAVIYLLKGLGRAPARRGGGSSKN